jgi:hypothetical protein
MKRGKKFHFSDKSHLYISRGRPASLSNLLEGVGTLLALLESKVAYHYPIEAYTLQTGIWVIFREMIGNTEKILASMPDRKACVVFLDQPVAVLGRNWLQ